ncbi:hypothetical protein PMAYCL1PPCAC_16054, partial [Pristionchus mayeri]
ALATCYIEQSESVRREVLSVVPQSTLAGCRLLCSADSNCLATLLNDAGDACVLLGAPITAPAPDTCSAPFTCHAKSEINCVDIPQGPIADGYAPGECSAPSDVVGDLKIDGTIQPCDIQSTYLNRVVIDAILHDGTHIVLENYYIALAIWDYEIGSWYITLTDVPDKF